MSWKHPCSFEKRLCFVLGCFSYFYCDLLGSKTLISFCATFACSHLSVNIIVLCRQCQVQYSEECILEVFINSWMFSYSSPATPPLSFVCVFQFVWNSVQVTKIIWMELCTSNKDHFICSQEKASNGCTRDKDHLFLGKGKHRVYK